jgi:TusE/DsrC/DsvC family sulfur relay protein
MPTITLKGKTYEVDEDGFLQELDKWSEEFAQEYAKEEGIEGTLTDEHWKLINYLRSYYQQFGIAPMIRKLCKETGFDLKKVYQLFPSGPAKGACKLAGLAKPTGCVCEEKDLTLSPKRRDRARTRGYEGGNEFLPYDSGRMSIRPTSRVPHYDRVSEGRGKMTFDNTLKSGGR